MHIITKKDAENRKTRRQRLMSHDEGPPSGIFLLKEVSLISPNHNSDFLLVCGMCYTDKP